MNFCSDKIPNNKFHCKDVKFRNPSFEELFLASPYDYETVEKVCIDIKDLKIAESFLTYCYRLHIDPIEKLNWLKNKL